MSLFFDLLSTDLQIWIIHSWLLADSEGTSQVLALSALDVACCSRRLRPSLLELLEHIPPFLDKPGHLGYLMKDIANYMYWVASRALAVQSLYRQEIKNGERISSEQLTTLESMQSLRIVEDCYYTTSLVLNACPIITSFAFSATSYLGFESACVSLADTSLPRLTTLDLALHTGMMFTVDLDKLTQALTRHGATLTSLVLSGISLSPALLDTIANHCPNLHSLDMCTARLSSECIIRLGNSLKHLTALRLVHHSDDKATIIAHVLQQLDHIKSVRVGTAFCGASSVADTQLLIANPNFDSLKLPNCDYNRIEQSLKLSLYKLTEADVVGVLNILPIAKLTVVDMNNVMSAELVSVMGMTVGSTLIELELASRCKQQHTIAFLSKCPNLKSAKFGYQVAFNADVVVVLSNCCKHLNYIGFQATMISPTVLVELLTKCRGLTEIKLGYVECITADMLQAIVDSGTVWALSWEKRCILGKEYRALSAFREMIKEKQLLPVPRLAMYCPCFGVCEQYDNWFDY